MKPPGCEEYTRGNERWKGTSSRTIEQRRGDKADRLFENLVKGTDFERLDGYHGLRHSFISILVAQGKTWDQIAPFVGHLDQETDLPPKNESRRQVRVMWNLDLKGSPDHGNDSSHIRTVHRKAKRGGCLAGQGAKMRQVFRKLGVE